MPKENRPISPAEAQAAGARSTWVSVWVNALLTIGQISAGVFSHSQGLIADGIHSLSDLMSDFVVLLAAHQSAKKADADHHYGHHRYETGASLALGMLLLFVGIGMIYAAIQKLLSPDGIPLIHPSALWVALFALFAKEALFQYMFRIAKRANSAMLIANAWHARSDALASLVVAIGIGGNLLGYAILDPLAAFVVGSLVARIGWKFAWSALQDLMDRAISEEDIAAIQATLAATPGVYAVHDMRTRKTGDHILVDVHLEVAPDITVLEAHAISVQAARRAIEKHGVLDVLTHIDPYGHPDEK